MKDKQPHSEQSIAGHDLLTRSISSGTAIIEDQRRSNWEQISAYLLENQFHIFALRGAGSVNGMDREEIDALLPQLQQRIQVLRQSRAPVAIVFDGDPDSLDRPDIGYVAGRLIDQFGNDPDDVLFLTAQKQSWYYPETEGRNLANALGRSYATVVFADNTFAGDHNAFTQSAELVRSPRYEQWYIGASGPIATEQLADFNAKVPVGSVRTATIYRVHNNADLSSVIENKLALAVDAGDQQKATKFQKQIDQRQNPYGAHWTPNGEPSLNQVNFPNLKIEWVLN